MSLFVITHQCLHLDMRTEISDVDMDDAEQANAAEDFEKGIIGALDSPRVSQCSSFITNMD